ncbi:MAG: hypothetical protein SGI92_30890 [Bryobacteraceae bacterium]|nr:hypothetical protein [Bryobacteraceae bacterium]
MLICTAEQWAAVQTQFPNTRPGVFRGREFLSRNWGTRRVVFLHVGDGVVASAASTQFGIDRWDPNVLLSTTAATQEETEAIFRVAELNGVPLMGEPIIASNLEGTVPPAIATPAKAGPVLPNTEPGDPIP